MEAQDPNPICTLGEDDPLRVLLEGTATVTGERFFEALVENLSSALNTKCAWITEYLEDVRRLRALAFWVDGQLVPDFEIDIEDTPCEAVINKAQLVHYPDNIRDLFPSTLKLNELGAVSYMGVPLLDLNGSILGHLAVIDNRPMPEEPKSVALFHIFAARAAAELQRIRAESEVKAREEKLSRLVDSAMDAIIELDEELNIVMLNPAAQTVFNFRLDEYIDRSFLQFLSTESHRKINGLIQELNERPEGRKYLWIPGGLRARNLDGEEFTAEATLSQFEMRRRIFYTLILRNVNERLEAERIIRSLREEAAYLKEEIKALDDYEEIIAGRFRADLFYRLNVYPITVPPLRERREDIPELVKYFTPRISTRLGKVIDHIPSAFINQLVAYDWPGNVRELKNVVERAIIASPDTVLLLPEALGVSPPELATASRKQDFTSLKTLERQYIMNVLQATGWRVSGPKGAANILDLNPSTLRYRIKKLGIHTPW